MDAAKTPRSVLPVLALLLGGGLAYCLGQTEPTPPADNKLQQAPVVRVVIPRAGIHHMQIATQGLVKPAQEVTVHAELVGKVLGHHPQLTLGGFLPKGARILRLDPVDYALAVDQQRAQVAQAQLEQEVEAARKTIADREWQMLGRANTRSSGLARSANPRR